MASSPTLCLHCNSPLFQAKMPKAYHKKWLEKRKWPYTVPKRVRCRDKYEKAYQKSLQRIVRDGDSSTTEDGGEPQAGPAPSDSRCTQDVDLNQHRSLPVLGG